MPARGTDPGQLSTGAAAARQGAIGGAIAGVILSILLNGADLLVLICFLAFGALCGSVAWGLIVAQSADLPGTGREASLSGD